jgi:hypothetical protein
MSNALASVRLRRCFDAEWADLIRGLPNPTAGKSVCPTAKGDETDHNLPLLPEASCLQRWLDLNA